MMESMGRSDLGPAGRSRRSSRPRSLGCVSAGTARLGRWPRTVREWVKQAELDAGLRFEVSWVAATVAAELGGCDSAEVRRWVRRFGRVAISARATSPWG
jgi:hypothetical protein